MHLLTHTACTVPGCHNPGPKEAHDIQPYAELTPAQRESYQFLRQNLATYCRPHHMALHGTDPGAVDHRHF